MGGVLFGGERSGVVGVFPGETAEGLAVLGDLDLPGGVAFGLSEECFFCAAVALASFVAGDDGADEWVGVLGGEWHGVGSFWC